MVCQNFGGVVSITPDWMHLTKLDAVDSGYSVWTQVPAFPDLYLHLALIYFLSFGLSSEVSFSFFVHLMLNLVGCHLIDHH